LQGKIHLIPPFSAKRARLPQPFTHDQDVAEQDCCVEAKPPDRLQGNFGGEFRRLDHLDEGMLQLQGADSGKARPAWRMNQIGGRSTGWHRQAARKRSRLLLGADADSIAGLACAGSAFEIKGIRVEKPPRPREAREDAR
jgi:hypothetical protein